MYRIQLNLSFDEIFSKKMNASRKITEKSKSQIINSRIMYIITYKIYYDDFQQIKHKKHKNICNFINIFL